MNPNSRTITLALWAICFGVACGRLYDARTAFDEPDRPDGNSGHTSIDFGGQWMMGRQVVLGHERELYHRDRHWQLAWATYPREDEPPDLRKNAFPKHLRDADRGPKEIRHDAEQMMYWFMGDDSPRWKDAAVAVGVQFLQDAFVPNPFSRAIFEDLAKKRLTPEAIVELERPAIGGPLYPPIHGFLYAPLALDPEPRSAYRTFQILSILLTFVAGGGLSAITRGRIAWPLATLAVMLFPGYQAGLQLGQNHVLTLAILAWGWAFAVRSRDSLGGAIWGLLAFKPVWGAAFFLLPLLQRRWRFCGAMVLVGGGMCVATLPVVGIETWFEWLAVGKEASATYEVNENWIHLSRDLGGIPRRAMVDFRLPEPDRTNPRASQIGWAFWLVVFTLTVGTCHLRGDRRFRTGLGAGFLSLGAYLTCYRFIFYDAVLALVPLAILFADPRIVLRRGIAWPAVRFPLFVVGLLFAIENWLKNYAGASSLNTPWDTVLLLSLWAWCGWRLVRYGDRGELPAA